MQVKVVSFQLSVLLSTRNLNHVSDSPVENSGRTAAPCVSVPVLYPIKDPEVHEHAHLYALWILMKVAARGWPKSMLRKDLVSDCRLSTRQITRGLQYLAKTGYMAVAAVEDTEGHLNGKAHFFHPDKDLASLPARIKSHDMVD